MITASIILLALALVGHLAVMNAVDSSLVTARATQLTSFNQLIGRLAGRD